MNQQVKTDFKNQVLEFKELNPTYSNRSIAKVFGVHHKTIWRILNKRLEPNDKLKKAATSFKKVFNENSGYVETTSSERISTLEQLIEYCKIDTTVWDIERWTCNKWEVGSKDDLGTVLVTPLFQIKAFLRKKIDLEAVRKEIDSLKELAREYPWPATKNFYPTPSTGLMLEVNIPDLHMGKLACEYETGWKNYDTKIAESTFWTAFEKILSRASGYKFEQILFVIGNDMMNYDDIEGRTTSGTYVTTDTRYHKTFTTTRNITIRAINRLKELAPVKVIPVYGNHDRRSSWHLGDSVEMFFWNDSQVEVDNRPRPRKFHEFGSTMLMFTHGDKGKKNDYPLIMATEQPEMFGRCKFRECHTGHTHQTKLDEQHGVRVRVLPALCSPDDWHSENGFVGNLRSAEGYIWDKEEGLISIVLHTEKD